MLDRYLQSISSLIAKFCSENEIRSPIHGAHDRRQETRGRRRMTMENQSNLSRRAFLKKASQRHVGRCRGNCRGSDECQCRQAGGALCDGDRHPALFWLPGVLDCLQDRVRGADRRRPFLGRASRGRRVPGHGTAHAAAALQPLLEAAVHRTPRARPTSAKKMASSSSMKASAPVAQNALRPVPTMRVS